MKQAVRDYRDLRVWQAAMDLATRIYEQTEKFPNQEKFGLISQLRRAAVSIPSNIAEGHQRESTAEYLHFLSVAQGSLAEVETQVELSVRLSMLAPDMAELIQRASSDLRKQLYALRNALKSKTRANP